MYSTKGYGESKYSDGVESCAYGCLAWLIVIVMFLVVALYVSH